MSNPVVARYWTGHCVHSRPFATLDEAIRFLAEGAARHEFAADAVVGVDGGVLVARERLAPILQVSDEDRHRALRALLAEVSLGG